MECSTLIVAPKLIDVAITPAPRHRLYWLQYNTIIMRKTLIAFDFLPLFTEFICNFAVR